MTLGNPSQVCLSDPHLPLDTPEIAQAKHGPALSSCTFPPHNLLFRPGERHLETWAQPGLLAVPSAARPARQPFVWVCPFSATSLPLRESGHQPRSSG